MQASGDGPTTIGQSAPRLNTVNATIFSHGLRNEM
jgi:hypothetical protein